MHIGFNRPAVVGQEIEYMQKSIRNWHMSGNGPYTKMAERKLTEIMGARYALLTSSCTHALEMTAMLLDIQHGDEVIVPAFTFVSTVNAFVLRGAKPIFIDIRPDTLNMDETLLKDLITDQTRAIVPVHYAGVGCEMTEIMAEVESRPDISVIEDNAHGLFATYKGQSLGTFGKFATQSFHETKNIHCGEGGALIVNDPDFRDRAEIIREKGTNRTQFFRGQVDKYTWVDIGSSYLLSDTMAAFLFVQLENAEKIQAKRKQIWDYYCTYLQDWAATNQVQLPTIPSYVEQAYHLFYMLMPDTKVRDRFIATLRSQNIVSTFHYQPLNRSTFGQTYTDKHCPVTEDVSQRLVRLPMYYDLTDPDLERIVENIHRFKF